MVDYLDPEIANEGAPAEWMPAIAAPRIPTYEGIKSIAKYFPQFTGRPYQHQAFPCWLYHPKQGKRLIQDVLSNEDPPRVIKRAAEVAKELGCVFRASTAEERAQGFPANRWEYKSEWRATPFDVKFDPNKPDTGKHIVTSSRDNGSANADMIAATVAAVLAKIAPAGPSGPAPEAHADPDYIEFQAFKAWKAQLAAPEAQEEPQHTNALHDAQSGDEKADAIAQAEKRGVKIDKRWSVDRILAELSNH